MRQRIDSCECRVPREALWDFLSDYNNVVAMGSPGASARLVKGDSQLCDCVYEAEITWQGSTSRFTACVVDAIRPETLTWDAETGTGRSWLRFDLEPVNSQITFVTVSLRFEGSPWAQMLEALAWGFLSTALDRTLVELSQMSQTNNSGG